jgi:glycosyltransferase involved in cell wall biosynthesis
LRILLAHNFYSVTGGAEVFYHEVGRVLAEQGHEVAWFSGREEDADTPWTSYFPAAADYSNGGLLRRVLSFPKMVYNVEAKAAMSRLIADFQPDVIHAFATYVRLTPAILDAAREAGVPVVLSCNDYKHLCPNYKLYHHGHICEECKGGHFYRALVNRCCHGSLAISAASMLEGYVHDWLDIWRKNVSCFLFASEFMANKTEEFWGKGSVKIDFLPNPFDATKYHVPANVGQYILYFGRLIGEKGVDNLIEAARLAPDVPVVIVGDGPDREKLEAIARPLSNVRLVGPAWGEDLSRWLHDARAVVVPSLWHENFPYVIFQAFAASKPVIGSRRGGIPELVEAGSHGWTYAATDVAQLAERMKAVLSVPDAEIAAMGEAAREYVTRQFNDAAIYQRLTRIYKGVLQ